MVNCPINTLLAAVGPVDPFKDDHEPLNVENKLPDWVLLNTAIGFGIPTSVTDCGSGEPI